jgi:dolichyl-phosphate beta-glucosyltransferase
VNSPEGPMIRLSIIVPAYNEEARIRPTLEEYATYFTRIYGDDYEIIVVMNGCTDDTRGVVESVQAHVPQLRLLEFPQPTGKGGAIMEGFAAAKGELFAFVDADNMVRAPQTERLVGALDDSDIVIGDRFGGRDLGAGGQPLYRQLIGKALRAWVRAFLRLPYSDTQCGAKAFRADGWRSIAPQVRERGWAFDLDVLVNARRRGLSVAEVPVEWKHVAEGSKVRAAQAGPEFLLATFRIRLRRR